MNTSSDATPNSPLRRSSPAGSHPPVRELDDEELAWSLLADLGDAAVDLADEHAATVVEVFNMVAEVVRPRRLVTDPSRTLPGLIADACAVLHRLATTADSLPLVSRYLAADLQLRALADQLGYHLYDTSTDRRATPS
jgi:hypothetical protein